jgi:hypothetical protein
MCKTHLKHWKDYTVSVNVFDKCEGSVIDDSYESYRGSTIGVQKGGKGQYNLSRGKKSWFKVPKEFGGKKKKVISTNNQSCHCKKHITQVYSLEDDILVYFCDTVKSYAWRMK